MFTNKDIGRVVIDGLGQQVVLVKDTTVYCNDCTYCKGIHEFACDEPWPEDTGCGEAGFVFQAYPKTTEPKD